MVVRDMNHVGGRRRKYRISNKGIANEEVFTRIKKGEFVALLLQKRQIAKYSAERPIRFCKPPAIVGVPANNNQISIVEPL